MVVQQVKSYFERKGIKSSRIGAALLIFKVSTYGHWAGTLYLCYRFRPVKSFFTKWSGPRRIHDYMRNRYRTKYDRAQNYINEKAHKLAEWKYFRPIPRSLGVEPQRFTIALAENIILYKATLPIVVPLQIWLILLALRSNDTEHVSPIDLFQDQSYLEDLEPEIVKE